MSPSRLFFSADEVYLHSALDELRELYPDAELRPVGPDLGSFAAEGVAIAELATACRERPVVFVRHLFREVGSAPAAARAAARAAGQATSTSLEDVVAIALGTWSVLPVGPAVALQVWASGDVDTPFRTDELWHALADALTARGTDVARGGREQILTACVTTSGIIFGLNGLSSALTDWPGGRVRLAKPKGQISRSEFKLEELFRMGELELPAAGIAVDLGASPGGWTRILRQRGLRVWAVDPAALDPRIARDPEVHHIRTTAGDFLSTTTLKPDLIVNDMRMAAELSASVMLSASRVLKPGGLGVQTLKIAPNRAMATVQTALRMLRQEYEIVFVRQLHHNRNEVTVVLRRPV
ncbi:MAG: 23S rRNA (cytidine(2498)-2'-O)-methyltransferase [uncultured Thermomicrobiales bacterium]|uniref:23S rRNA (Cytidine(2498)-2'-O)-methyltransferase n=1 Tax=uncultured Thermomicrobiales bacterium TaxID=1645740 RepID=A0A6J4UFY9_9BACT|nr:MAG: 23S rRNA (cytidine(2498)-2'-O)-methyltransferase [uncultured Thermomicrobiales bacterium]